VSDLAKIADPKKGERAHGALDHRQTKALEDAADALEGIRQDLTTISGQLTKLVQAVLDLKGTR
jgi:hypothetical protein